MRIGRNIRARRKELGLTQTEVAQDIVSVSYISLVENSKIEPPMSILKLLAKRLQTTVERLQDNENEENADILNVSLQKIRKCFFESRLNESGPLLISLTENISFIKNSSIRKRIQLYSLCQSILVGKMDKAELLLTEFEDLWTPLDIDTDIYVDYLIIKTLYLSHCHQYYRANTCVQQLEDMIFCLNELVQPVALLFSAQIKAQLGDTRNSYKNLFKAQELFLEQGRWIEVCRTRLAKARIDQICGDLTQSRKELLSCESLLLIIDHPFLLMTVYQNLGSVALLTGDCDSAIKYLGKSLQLNLPEDCSEFLAKSLYKLARVFFNQCQYDLALEYINKTLNHATCYLTIGHAHLLSAKIEQINNHLDKVEKILTEAKKAAIKSKNPTLLNECNTQLGHFYYSLGKFSQAAMYFLASLNINHR